FLTDELPELDLAHALDQPGTEDERDDQRGERRPRRPERDVPEDIESGDHVPKRIEEVVQHYRRTSSRSSCSIVTILSRPIPRDALINTRSPRRMKVSRNDPAASASPK